MPTKSPKFDLEWLPAGHMEIWIDTYVEPIDLKQKTRDMTFLQRHSHFLKPHVPSLAQMRIFIDFQLLTRSAKLRCLEWRV